MIKWVDATDEEVKRETAIKRLFATKLVLGDYFFRHQTCGLTYRAGMIHEVLWQFGRQDQLLMKAALDMWSANGHLYLFEMIDDWDREIWIDFIKAMRFLKDIRLDELADTTPNGEVYLRELF